MSLGSVLQSIVSQLSDDELIAVGPDVITALTTISANPGDLVAGQLALHRLAASVMADQVQVKTAVIGQLAGAGISSLQAAIDAAKARQAAAAAPTFVAKP